MECCIKGCFKESVSLGLCINHYRRNRRYGSPVASKQATWVMRGKTDEERFHLQVEKSDGCWKWSAGRDKDGYGVFKAVVNGEQFRRAHRYSYALHKGSVGDLMVCHTCDNPWCVNPDHLFLGSGKDNQADKWQKGRGRALKGELAPHVILTEESVRKILADPRPFSKIAADYGVATSTIGSIKQRVSWAHVDGESVVTPRTGRILETPRHAKLSPETVKEIRTRTEGATALAREYGISRQTINDIRTLRSWTHL